MLCGKNVGYCYYTVQMCMQRAVATLLIRTLHFRPKFFHWGARNFVFLIFLMQNSHCRILSVYFIFSNHLWFEQRTFFWQIFWRLNQSHTAKQYRKSNVSANHTVGVEWVHGLGNPNVIHSQRTWCIFSDVYYILPMFIPFFLC